MGRCSKWNLLPNGSVGIAIWQRLFLHRFPASEGLPGFLSWRAIARRIWSAAVRDGLPFTALEAIASQLDLPSAEIGVLCGFPPSSFPWKGTFCSIHAIQTWPGCASAATRLFASGGAFQHQAGQAARHPCLSFSPVIERYWRHWLGWASSRPHGLAPVVYSAARACIPHTNTDS